MLRSLNYQENQIYLERKIHFVCEEKLLTKSEEIYDGRQEKDFANGN